MVFHKQLDCFVRKNPRKPTLVRLVGFYGVVGGTVLPRFSIFFATYPKISKNNRPSPTIHAISSAIRERLRETVIQLLMKLLRDGNICHDAINAMGRNRLTSGRYFFMRSFPFKELYSVKVLVQYSSLKTKQNLKK